MCSTKLGFTSSFWNSLVLFLEQKAARILVIISGIRIGLKAAIQGQVCKEHNITRLIFRHISIPV
jgi:hypothetical protein